jgi:hypothetical protein
MQAINVIVAFSVNQFFVILAREWIVCKCFAFFDHNPLAFEGNTLMNSKAFFPMIRW